MMQLITGLGLFLFLSGISWFLWFLCWKRHNERGEIIPIPFDFDNVVNANISLVLMVLGIVIVIASLKLGGG